jgi:hypothetical protein
VPCLVGKNDGVKVGMREDDKPLAIRISAAQGNSLAGDLLIMNEIGAASLLLQGDWSRAWKALGFKPII